MHANNKRTADEPAVAKAMAGELQIYADSPGQLKGVAQKAAER
jgi:hypothetical protein